MKNNEIKKWLSLKENEMLAEMINLNGVVVDDHKFVRASKSGVLDGFVCKTCGLGVGYAICKGDDNGAPCVVYPF